MRLYAEGQELLEHKKLLYSKFGLEKVPIKKASTMGTTTATASSRDPRSSDATTSTSSSSQPYSSTAHVNQVSKPTAVAAKRASVHSAGSRATNSAGSPSKERRTSMVYLPPGGRSPTAAAIKQVFAKTYSLQSTMASRAAVAPRRKPSVVTTRRPSSPTGGARRHPGPAAATKSPAAATKPHRINTTSTSLGRGGAPQRVHSKQNQRPTTQAKQVTSRMPSAPTVQGK